MKIQETNIKGLLLLQEELRYAKGGAGPVLRVAPELDDKTSFPCGAENVIAVVTNDPLVLRGEHYHKKTMELVVQLHGSSLWYFLDMRDDSPTKGAEYLCIVGVSQEDIIDIPEEIIFSTPSFFFENSKTLTKIQTPPGIYHVVWSLSKNPSVFVEVKSEKFSEDDYVRIDLKDIKSSLLASLL